MSAAHHPYPHGKDRKVNLEQLVLRLQRTNAATYDRICLGLFSVRVMNCFFVTAHVKDVYYTPCLLKLGAQDHNLLAPKQQAKICKRGNTNIICFSRCFMYFFFEWDQNCTKFRREFVLRSSQNGYERYFTEQLIQIAYTYVDDSWKRLDMNRRSSEKDDIRYSLNI